jgi:hypothetical protein
MLDRRFLSQEMKKIGRKNSLFIEKKLNADSFICILFLKKLKRRKNEN